MKVKTIIPILVIFALAILITLSNPMEAEVQSFHMYVNELETYKSDDFTLSVYLPKNGSEFANNQIIEILVAVAWHPQRPLSNQTISIIGNNYLIAELSEEKMYKINITLMGNATNVFTLKFVYNNFQVVAKYTYFTTLTAPALPFYYQLPELLRPKPKPKIKLETEQVIVLEEEFKKEIAKAQTLIIALLLALFLPFVARWIKQRIKYEDFVNTLNLPLIVILFFVAYLVVLITSQSLYVRLDGLAPVFKHELYARVFAARVLVATLIVGIATSSYFVGWKLTELENIYPMLVVSPEFQYVELWYLVIYEAEVDGVLQTCVAPVNFGSIWRRLKGDHIILQRQQYAITLNPETKEFQLEVQDVEAPLESGWSFGKMFMKIFPNLILAEDIELYDDYGEQLMVLMENMTEEEIELRKTNYKEWLKKYGKKYKGIKRTRKMRILLSDAHYNPLRIIYDSDIVKTLLTQLKAYQAKYNTLRGLIPTISDTIVAQNIIQELRGVIPSNLVVGDIHNITDNIVNSLAFGVPLNEIMGEEEVNEIIREALAENEDTSQVVGNEGGSEAPTP